MFPIVQPFYLRDSRTIQTFILQHTEKGTEAKKNTFESVQLNGHTAGFHPQT